MVKSASRQFKLGNCWANISITPNEYLKATQIHIAVRNDCNRDVHVIIRAFDRILMKYFSLWDALLFNFKAPDSFQFDVKELKFLTRPTLTGFVTDLYFTIPAGTEWGGFFILTKLVPWNEERANTFLNALMEEMDLLDEPPAGVIKTVSEIATGIGETIGGLVGGAVEGTARGLTRGLFNPSVILLLLVFLIAFILYKLYKSGRLGI